ncbi:peptidoglycan/xylan/chitin deacetylase (PgdA/CDA1 family) [Streptomyces sp. 1114.5]|uniref:polysaccharide deacetylase family protein n=1 Tax=unclassified Streptomyces TaxID=2593676 RepID=UPI000BD5DC48|nr:MULTISPECIES: polysaccharide deacetylase family protein [unclassified Streptomyces]RKT18847.1 peptidoglycan/xylan/chitin deacetylase (PgdA/CDA1 family) [Streptomyces sp. 1114.5]SOB85045.1 Peptidoglycan/xylan/chitin deacetylase, PgdA/CDA1 family [Streptomyces sp. 1331.2]
MTADRRTVLRTTAKMAALTATAGLLTACGTGTPRRADPGALAAHPGTVDPQHTTDPAWNGGEGPASPAPTAPAEPAEPQAAAGAGATAAQPSAPPTPPPLPPLAAGTPVEVVYGPRTGRNVALTFHGSGDPKLATALLEIAEQRGAKLTVMVVGSWLDQQPQMARRILDGGHELGNHTQNHLNISAMTPDQARAEIAQCAERLQRLTGSIGRWFRPSAAQYATPMVREQARAVGYEHVLSFDVDPRDYSDPSAAELQRRVLNSVRGGSVVALHMGHQCTVDALPAILDGLAKAGLKPVTASQLCA